MAKAQEQLFDASQDPAIVKAVDELVDLFELAAVTKKKLERSHTKVIGILKDHEKKRIQHRGVTIEYVKTESKEKLKLKGVPVEKEKKPKKERKEK
jgi:hypothetical protein